LCHNIVIYQTVLEYYLMDNHIVNIVAGLVI